MATNLVLDGDMTVAGAQTVTSNVTFQGGTTIGNAASDTVGFYGATPVVQLAVLAAITTTQPTVTVFGFATTAQFNLLIAAVNTVIANMKTLGLMATA